jgi:hypothetical protein
MRRFLSKLSKRRGLWTIVIIFAVLFVTTPQISNASWWDALSLESIVSKGVFYVAYFISAILGVVIALLSWFLQLILQMGMNLVNSSPVRVGFPIVLSIANLFFVGALIVIAIATILRREEYGAKKVLWKLVVMAVMVNFGLVICGTLLSISDQTATFFIESISPGSSGPNGETNFAGFADSIAGAFNPQNSILSQKDITENPGESQVDLSAAASAGDTFGAILKPLVSLLSTLGSLVIIIITLASLIGMLLWRYIRLGIALIVLPLAWAAWIFPVYQQHYKKWWTKFTQWAIFPPVVIFFIWLGLKISEIMSQKGGEFAVIYKDGGENGIAAFFGSLLMKPISQALNSFILFGLMMGGMMAAQELGIKGAEGAVKAMEGVGKGTKNWAMNRAKQAPGALKQRVGGQKYDMTNKGMGKLLNPLRKGANKLIGEPKKDAAGNITGMRGKAVAGLGQVEKLQDRLGLASKNKEKAPTPERTESMLRQDGETREAWETRVAKNDKTMKRKQETSEEWQARVGLAAQADPKIKRKGNESMEAWKNRVVKRNPALADKSETEEAWEARVKEKEEKNVGDYKEASNKWSEDERKRKQNNSLLSSVMGGVKSNSVHKKLKKEEVEKALGVHFEGGHEEGGGGEAAHAPKPAGDGDAHGHG